MPSFIEKFEVKDSKLSRCKEFFWDNSKFIILAVVLFSLVGQFYLFNLVHDYAVLDNNKFNQLTNRVSSLASEFTFKEEDLRQRVYELEGIDIYLYREENKKEDPYLLYPRFCAGSSCLNEKVDKFFTPHTISRFLHVDLNKAKDFIYHYRNFVTEGMHDLEDKVEDPFFKIERNLVLCNLSYSGRDYGINPSELGNFLYGFKGIDSC